MISRIDCRSVWCFKFWRLVTRKQFSQVSSASVTSIGPRKNLSLFRMHCSREQSQSGAPLSAPIRQIALFCRKMFRAADNRSQLIAPPPHNQSNTTHTAPYRIACGFVVFPSCSKLQLFSLVSHLAEVRNAREQQTSFAVVTQSSNCRDLNTALAASTCSDVSWSDRKWGDGRLWVVTERENSLYLLQWISGGCSGSRRVCMYMYRLRAL